jgi:HTH-type transcriptional regulator/antitoxin HigA
VKKVIGNGYLQLFRRFPLRPIRSEAELGRATEVIDDLISRSDRTADEDDYLDVLSDVVEKYETEHHPIPAASPVEVLRFLIDDRQTNQRAVALASGIHTSTMSEILAGRRRMNLEHMQKLAAFLKVDIGVFLPAQKKRRTPKRAAAKK